MTRSAFKFALLFSILFFSYGIAGEKNPLVWQFIPARDDGISKERPLLYRARLPSGWIRNEFPVTESIYETTKCNCEFTVVDGNDSARITIHTFPIDDVHPRISPEAQIARWKGQFSYLDPLSTTVSSESSGGFSGICFEGEGIVEGQKTGIIARSMQLAPVYDNALKQERIPEARRKRADYTLKATGSPAVIEKNRGEILRFFDSFELVDELPAP